MAAERRPDQHQPRQAEDRADGDRRRPSARQCAEHRWKTCDRARVRVLQRAASRHLHHRQCDDEGRHFQFRGSQPVDESNAEAQRQRGRQR